MYSWTLSNVMIIYMNILNLTASVIISKFLFHQKCKISRFFIRDQSKFNTLLYVTTYFFEKFNTYVCCRQISSTVRNG